MANRGKMRQIDDVKRSKIVVEIGVFYYRLPCVTLGDLECRGFFSRKAYVFHNSLEILIQNILCLFPQFVQIIVTAFLPYFHNALKHSLRFITADPIVIVEHTHIK